MPAILLDLFNLQADGDHVLITIMMTSPNGNMFRYGNMFIITSL